MLTYLILGGVKSGLVSTSYIGWAMFADVIIVAIVADMIIKIFRKNREKKI